jgi:hypothetical protein
MNVILLLVLFVVSFNAMAEADMCNVNPTVEPQYTLSLCTMIHNEGWYIEEWLAYHLLLKVDHFYIYNDRSTDAIHHILGPYIKRGIVTLIPWNHTAQTVDPSLVAHEPRYTRPQRFAIADCLFNHQKESKFFGVWDVDEFAVLNDSFSDLVEFLWYNDQRQDDYEIPITIYGSSNYTSTPQGLVIDNFRMRSKLTVFGINPDDNKFSGKSIYKSGCGTANVHHSGDLMQTPDYKCRKNTTGWCITEGSRTHLPLTINHYAVKSWEHFKEKNKKWHFGLNQTLFDTQLQTSNNYRDEVLVRFVEPVNEVIRCMRFNNKKK